MLVINLVRICEVMLVGIYVLDRIVAYLVLILFVTTLSRILEVIVWGVAVIWYFVVKILC